MGSRRASLCVVSLIASLAVGAATGASVGSTGSEGIVLSNPPETAKRPVTDTYWGTPVVDDYQYLERTDYLGVRDWAEAQSQRTRKWIDAHADHGESMRRLREFDAVESSQILDIRRAGDRYFALEKRRGNEQLILVAFESLDSVARRRVIVDPTAIDPMAHTSIDFFVPSPDGSKVAVSLSERGTENGTLYLYDAATGAPMADRIPRVNGGTAGGSAAWAADGQGIYVTRYPAPGERPDEDLPFYQQLVFHRLGSPISDDPIVLGPGLPRIAEISVATNESGTLLVIDVSNGDGGEHAYWIVRAPGEAPIQIARFQDAVVDARFGRDGRLYLQRLGATPKGSILRLDPAEATIEAATVVVPEGEGPIQSYALTDGAIHVTRLIGGPSILSSVILATGATTTYAWEEAVSIGDLVPLGGDSLLCRSQSYTKPPAYFIVQPGEPAPRPTGIATPAAADFSDCETQLLFAPAEDGTPIPLTILMRRGTPLDGTAPALLYGYGSYGISQTPSYKPERRILLDRGMVLAFAGVRGGGEYGEEWHRAANLERKKTSMDDFAACARYLIDRGYTNTGRLACEGGSAGGLLVYGAMVLYPDLFRAVVAHVGIGDALRTELSPNGVFNTTEFGTVKDERQFRGMLAYSPYHNVKEGRTYPALLALTGLNDPRVEPWQSFKMVARMQDASTKGPVLLRTNATTGHGGGTARTERNRATADAYTFLFDQLGVGTTPAGYGAGTHGNP